LPAVAVRVCGDGVPGRAVAGRRSPHAVGCDPRVRAARPPLRRSRRRGERLSAGGDSMMRRSIRWIVAHRMSQGLWATPCLALTVASYVVQWVQMYSLGRTSVGATCPGGRALGLDCSLLRRGPVRSERARRLPRPDVALLPLMRRPRTRIRWIGAPGGT